MGKGFDNNSMEGKCEEGLQQWQLVSFNAFNSLGLYGFDFVFILKVSADISVRFLLCVFI